MFSQDVNDFICDLSFKEYVLVDFLSSSDKVNILCTSNQGVINILEEIFLKKHHSKCFDDRFYICSNVIKFRTIIKETKRKNFEYKFTYINICFSYSDPKIIIDNCDLDYKGCYYDGNKVYMTEKTRKCFKTKKSCFLRKSL
jgi:NAD(P)H-flavin reductase